MSLTKASLVIKAKPSQAKPSQAWLSKANRRLGSGGSQVLCVWSRGPFLVELLWRSPLGLSVAAEPRASRAVSGQGRSAAAERVGYFIYAPRNEAHVVRGGLRVSAS